MAEPGGADRTVPGPAGTEPGSGARTERDASSHLRHELRTPLNQIIGYSELLLELATEDGNTEYLPDLERIMAAGRRLVGLVDSIGRTQGSGSVAAGRGEANPPPTADTGRDGSEAVVENGGSLLVVDDSEANRDMLSRRLRARGYRVVAAADGAEALAALREAAFDLVLLDIMMPGISGLDVLREVRRAAAVAELPVIMVTARDASEDTVEALSLGANDYVTKPLDFPVVLARIRTQLSLARATAEVRRLADQLEQRNQFIRKTFGRYVSDEVVESLLASPEGLEIGGERRTVSILLSDLRSFTPLAEALTPEQVVRLLNNYLGTMAEVVGRYQGTVDEFIGDSVLALFGAPVVRPDDADRAVACAIAMQQAMVEVNRRNHEQGLPAVSMGIAVNTGEVVAGNIGSQRRTKYGVVGSPVNLAARIQARTAGGQVLISESCGARIAASLEVAGREKLTVKGFRDPITVLDVRGIGPPFALELAPLGGTDGAPRD